MSRTKMILRVAGQMTPEIIQGIGKISWRLAFPVDRKLQPGRQWWQRPGVGIMYQIEYRPGMDWERDFTEFNKSMMDEHGRLNFNGPFCKIEKWIELSKDAGADYHIFEAKWHDGICYFDTALTEWKTETDYCGQFAELSRKADIPFMYYYSTVFDHNPQFDSIQPNPHSTVSFISMEPQPVYEEYLRGHYREIMEQYSPDGMWIDWYWPDEATKLTIDFFRTNHPNTVLTFNISNYFPRSYDKLDYTSGEAHDLGGPYFRITRIGSAIVPVASSVWKWSTLGRRVHNHPSELIAPAGRWWQNPSLRDDPNDLVRMAAIVMASGGKFCIGATAQLDGGIYPDQVKQLKIIGEWYKPRKELFINSFPMKYRGQQPPGVDVYPKSVKAIACRHAEDILIHLINMDGSTRPIKIKLKGKNWDRITNVYIEQANKEVEIEKSDSTIKMIIRPDDIDPVDTILRLKST